MGKESARLTRLGEYMNRRRLELGLHWKDVQEASGLERMTIWRLRATEGPFLALTKAHLEYALDWEPGSVDAILAGGEPTPKPQRSDASSKDKEPEDFFFDEPSELPRDPWALNLYYSLAPLTHEMRLSLVRAAVSLRETVEASRQQHHPKGAQHKHRG